jgi:hypothetical protein
MNHGDKFDRANKSDKLRAERKRKRRETRERLTKAAPDLLAALKKLQKVIRSYGLLDIKKRFSLCAADAQANTAINLTKEK